jgi:glucokinase
METKTILGIDIGGTSIKYGIVQGRTLVEVKENKTNAFEVDSILESIYSIIHEALKSKIDAVGIGIPGFINGKTGIIELINNIPSLRGINLTEKIHKEFGLKAKINNDANCFTLGEYHFGSYKNLSNVIGITLGTGLGGGIIIHKKLYSGLHGGAGEFGCIPYLEKNFEYYCSSNFFKVFFDQSSYELYSKALNGDDIAKEGFYIFGMHLGALLNHLMFSFAPEAIIIGGKIAKAFDLFLPGVLTYTENYPVEFIKKEIQISMAEIEESGLVGAASLWF